MNFDIAGGLRNLLPGPLDSLRGPYDSLATANGAIPSVVVGGKNFREGKFVEIGTNGVFETYWWSGSGQYLNSDLVKYVEDPDLTNYAEKSTVYTKDQLYTKPEIDQAIIGLSPDSETLIPIFQSKIDKTEKNEANGVAPIDADKYLPIANLRPNTKISTSNPLESIDTSKVRRTGDTIYGLLDPRTNEEVSATRVTQWIDGRPMADAQVDGVLYFKGSNGEYFKRVIGSFIDSAWFFTHQNGNSNGTSGNDDSDNLRAIFELGRLMKKKVILRRPSNLNAHYRIDKPLVFGTSDIHIEAEDGVILNGTNLTSGYLFYIVGNISSTIRAIVQSNISIGDYDLPVTNVSTLASGDWVMIRSSTERFDEQRPSDNIFKSEIAKIMSIDSVNNRIKLDTPIVDSYLATTTTLSKITFVNNIKLKNITFKGKGATSVNPTLLQINQCMNVLLEDIKCIDGSENGINLTDCYNVTVVRPVTERINKPNYGDGIVVNGGAFININDGFFLDGRHGVDAGNLNVCRHLVVDNCRVFNMMASGLSTHGGNDYVTFSNNQIMSCGGGIIFRGRNCTAIYNNISGSSHLYPIGLNNYYSGILIGDGVAGEGYKGKAGTGLKLIGNRIEGAKGQAIHILANLKNAIIKDNYCNNFKWIGLDCSNGILHEDSLIIDNIFDCSGQEGDTYFDGTLTHENGFGMCFKQTKVGQSTALKNITIKGNIIKNTKNSCIKLMNTWSGNPSIGIYIQDNIMSYSGTAETGKYGIDMTVVTGDLIEISRNKITNYNDSHIIPATFSNAFVLLNMVKNKGASLFSLVPEMPIVINDTTLTTEQTSSQLNAKYPTALSKTEIFAPNVGTGMLYIKSTNGNWYKSALTVV